jgi:uncharacterized protein (AIM24 family)
VVVDGTSTKVPVNPSGTAQEVVMTGTVIVPTTTLVAWTTQVACSVELEQSVITVVRVEVVGVVVVVSVNGQYVTTVTVPVSVT